MPTGTPLRTLSNTTTSEGSENCSSPGLRNANTYIQQDHVILNTVQLQHHPTLLASALAST